MFSDTEKKPNTESPSSDSRLDMDEESSDIHVKEEKDETKDKMSTQNAKGLGDDLPSPESAHSEGNESTGKTQKLTRHLKRTLSNDSNDSTKSPMLTDCPKTPSGSPDPSQPVSEGSNKWIHLTEFELKGLKALVEKLESLPENKKCVPEGIEDPYALLEDMKVSFVKYFQRP